MKDILMTVDYSLAMKFSSVSTVEYFYMWELLF